jgi:hypothetical protein
MIKIIKFKLFLIYKIHQQKKLIMIKFKDKYNKESDKYNKEIEIKLNNCMPPINKMLDSYNKLYQT